QHRALAAAVRGFLAVLRAARERRWIRERQAAKFEFASRRHSHRNPGGPVVNTWLRRQNVVQTPHRSSTALENIGHPSKRNHRPDELSEIAVESNQCAE